MGDRQDNLTADVYALPHSPQRAPRAAYIHVPFCLHRCGYCDFTLLADRDDLIPAWLEALANELATLERPWPVDSLFIGGGTPTHLSPQQLDQLLQLVGQFLTLSECGEFSVEANPDGLDTARLEVLVRHGVNRLSLGVQSLDDRILQTLERQHTSEQATDCVHRCSRFIDNLSLDLIFGVPGQSVAGWRQTLRQAVDLPVRHVSTYGLTFEKGTDFTRRRNRGQLQALSDSAERQMYAAAMEDLSAAGFQHYEISNFARYSGPTDGPPLRDRTASRCRHNLVYWNADEYFAFGPGAARYVNGIRSTNRRHVTAWIDSWLRGQPSLQDVEQLNPDQQAREAVMLGLRLTDGINLETFAARYGCPVSELAPEAYAQYLKSGMLAESQGRLHLTDEGRFIADSVVLDFL